MPTSFRFDWVSLDSFRGFQGQGFKLDGLQPGITVVHGPNGAGKSSLVQAMELLLWEQVTAPEGTALSAGATVGDRPQARTRFGHRLAAKEGLDAAPSSPWPSPPTLDRYRLSLSDLLQAKETNQAFGDQLRQEMQGGVDFPAHRTAVGALTAFPRRGGLTAAYEQAEAAVRDQARTQDAQASLEADLRRQRAALEDQDGLEAQDRHLAALDRALDPMAELLERDAALAPFQDREPCLAGLKDDDERRFQELRAARDEARTEAGALQGRVEDLDAELNLLALPPGTQEEDAEAARNLAAAIQKAREDTLARATAFTEAEATLADWRQANPWLDLQEGQLPALSQEVLDRARSLARNFEQAQSLIHALKQVEADLGPEEAPAPLEPLTTATGLLERWLDLNAVREARTRLPETRGRWGGLAWALLAAGLLAGAAALVLGRGGSPLALGAVAAALALLVLAGQGLRARTGEDPERLELDLEALQQDFEALRLAGLTLPAWDPAEVRNLARRTREAAAQATGLALVNAARSRTRARLATENGAWGTLLAEAGHLARQLNLPAEVADAYGGYLELLGRRILDGLALRTALTTAESLHYAASEQLTLLNGRADVLLRAQGRTPGADLVAQLTTLAKAMDTALRLGREREALRKDLENLGRSDPQALLDAFLAQRGLDEARFMETWGTRQRWQPLMAAYTAQGNLVENLLAQEGQWTPEWQALADRGATPLTERQERFARARAGLRERHAAVQDTLRNLRETRDEVVRNEKTLEHLTQDGTQTALILARDQAAQKLEEQRVKDLEGRTLAKLLDRLERRGADEDLKPQLRRASDLFRDFTGHRYELRFEAGSFVAREGARTLALDQLSEGTRLQLLMAVRLAYVEHQEGKGGVQLPLFLDEVLANSDDTRALAVIAAIQVMARTGRQIFYFTAQQDEVAKWRHMGGEAIQFRDLAATRGLEAGRAHPLPAQDVTRRPIPDPGEDTLLAYVQRLDGAHGPALWMDLDLQHAWLAFAEGGQRTLHTLLQGGLDTIGQVRNFLKTQPGPEAEQQVTTLELLEEAQALLQAARPKPLTPGELAKAAIGIADLSNVLAAAQACDYQPKQLLEASIPGVGKGKRDNLRDWLEKGGYLRDGQRPVAEILAEVKGRNASRLGLEHPGWLAVERFLVSGDRAATP